MDNLLVGAIFGFLFSLLTWFITYYIQERKKANEKKLQTLRSILYEIDGNLFLLERKSIEEIIHHGFNTRIWEESQLHGDITDLRLEEQEKIRSLYQMLTISNTAVRVYYLSPQEEGERKMFDEAIIQNIKRTKPTLLKELKEASGIVDGAIRRK